jgi:hypothetical protein
MQWVHPLVNAKTISTTKRQKGEEGLALVASKENTGDNSQMNYPAGQRKQGAFIGTIYMYSYRKESSSHEEAGTFLGMLSSRLCFTS